MFANTFPFRFSVVLLIAFACCATTANAVPPDQYRIGVPDVYVDDYLAAGNTLADLFLNVENTRDVIFSDQPKTYFVDEPMYLEGKSNVHFFGLHRDSTILQLSSQFYASLESHYQQPGGKSLIPLTINNCQGLKFSKIQLDGRGDEFWQSVGVYGVLIMDCNRGPYDHGVHFSSCKFKDIGGNDGNDKNDPKAGHILMFAREFDNNSGDPNSTGRPFKNGGLTQYSEFTGRSAISSCDYNRFQSCHFIDDKNIADFALRVITDWTHDTPDPEETCYKTIVKNCLFRGGFDQNALEIGGPMTTESSVEGNTFKDTRLTPMEADKGASFNTFKDNIIDGVGDSQNNSQVFAIRDQGYPAHDGPNGNLEWLATGNEYIGNTIRNVIGDRRERTAAILINLSVDAEFVENCVEDSISTTNGDDPKLISVIMMQNFSGNVKLEDNGFPTTRPMFGLYDMKASKNYFFDVDFSKELLGNSVPPCAGGGGPDPNPGPGPGF